MKGIAKSAFTVLGVSVLLLAGCGSSQSTTSPATTPTSGNAAESTAQNTPGGANTSSSTAGSTTAESAQTVEISIQPDSKQGSDGKKHVAFSPADLKFTKGKPVQLVIKNYDTSTHTLTATDLNLNVIIQPAKSANDPVTTTATFTPDKAGTFSWLCTMPCDMNNGEWAMSQKGFMQGTITVNG
ncbi:cupredoxin domain-containing protein [Alicyclobacillus sp.]|uniref:cupredoxin domain-containing protein n=1 Tax=Alicyclobacillus sp. TaxID=61169 RepID=UPI0025C08E42|nr:cupredoxin domain-containing protein [Alicyclobacillus sp.]MCL6517040.1 cupredoxin domain-containing protein [Alicyclobacillus sp.]